MVDDAADARRAMIAAFEAFGAGDVQAMGHYHDRYTSFAGNGDSLFEGKIDREQLQAFFDAGFRVSWEMRDLGVRVFGSAAVATFYTEGTTRYPDGTVIRDPLRHTVVWVKEGDTWREAHSHVSKLRRGPE